MRHGERAPSAGDRLTRRGVGEGGSEETDSGRGRVRCIVRRRAGVLVGVVLVRKSDLGDDELGRFGGLVRPGRVGRRKSQLRRTGRRADDAALTPQRGVHSRRHLQVVGVDAGGRVSPRLALVALRLGVVVERVQDAAVVLERRAARDETPRALPAELPPFRRRLRAGVGERLATEQAVQATAARRPRAVLLEVVGELDRVEHVDSTDVGRQATEDGTRR